ITSFFTDRSRSSRFNIAQLSVALRSTDSLHAQFSGWDSLNIYLERAVTSITEQHGVSNMVRLLQAVGFEFLLGTGIPRGLDPQGYRQTQITDLPQLVGEEPAELAHVRAESGQNTLLAVGVFVQSYSTSGSTSNLPDRSGCDADFKNCREISEMLGCIKNNIYMLHGYNILKSTYSDFIKAILNSCKRHSANASSNIKIYLFISAHGSQDGFVLSDGTVVELPKLVNKLKKIASHVRVFYQACRGAYRHSVDELSTGLEGFSFEVFSFEDAATAGSSLPSLVPGCSALFASCPGHMAYSRPDTGGWMLQALHKVLEDCPRIRQTNLSSIEDFRQLANMVQRCMQDLVGGKPIKCEKTQSHGQIQFVLHLPE
ncbi:hypothetical protein BOX15_Mlig023916g1, partial [Macrostomum lignano]